MEADGVLLIDKPTGCTSHDVVDFVRRRFHFKKVGHCGTLDPLATGLLMLVIGKATKIQDLLMAEDKEYAGTMKLGVSTDSQDSDGKVLEERPVPALTRDQLWTLVEGPEHDRETRTAAARALATTGSEGERARLRIAAEHCAEPKVRVELLGIARGATVAERELALDEEEQALAATPPLRLAR